MAKAGSAYPQVEPRVAALMDSRVAECAPARRADTALQIARQAGAKVLVLGKRRAARRRDLERVTAWGVDDLRVGDVARDDVAVLPVAAPEIAARRLLIEGAPLILVRDGRRVVGVIDAEAVEIVRPSVSVAHRLDHAASPLMEARIWLLRVAGKVGEGLGLPIFAVGGVIRDLLQGRVALDVDLAVEGDGVAFARQLRDEIGGTLVVHGDFATASIEGATPPTGPPFGRIDVASARREQYEAPGALPKVSPASIQEDLRRRDFSVNALAMALQPSTFGRLLDPLGGQRDLRERRLKPLHPLSFVEDPTRVFRAARYAARLGLRLDRSARRAIELALRVGGYPALSGQRLHVEIDLMAAETTGWRAFELLLKWKALKMWHAEYRSTKAVVSRVRAAARLLAWAHRVGVGVDAGELALIALLADQRIGLAESCLARLAITGDPARRLHEGMTAGPLARRLDGNAWRRPSEVAEALDRRPLEALAGAWIRGGRRARRRIEWFVRHGRGVRPRLSGDDVVALGVARGPGVGRCLAALRRLRLDRVVTTRSEEEALVRAWASRTDAFGMVEADAGRGLRQRGRDGRVPSETRHARTRGEA